MNAAVELLAAACLAGGAFFCLVGAVGLVRMPDLYTRMHAASVLETLGAYLLLAGFMLQAGFTLVTAKLAMIGLLLFFAAPTATHALALAAWTRGVAPQLAPGTGGEPPSKP